jgi:RNA 2',3'-cyclic 3'-phosphodiesterase
VDRAVAGASVGAVSNRQSAGAEAQRLFVALDPPEPTREKVARWAEGAASSGLRPVRREALHLTLAFLGDRSPAEVSRAIDIVGRADPRPVEVVLAREPVPVPKRRPRLFALSAESGAAVAVQSGLADELTREGLVEPERRAFWPHLTVLRVRRGWDGKPPPAWDGHAFGAVRVALYRSVLGSEPRYDALTHVDLPPVEDRG